MTLSPPKTHLLFLDSLRALTAIYVVAHHSALHYFKDSSMLFGWQKALISSLKHGHFAVNLFIVLSGFSLMLSITKNNYEFKEGVLGFFKRRVIRIIPPYYLAMLFSLILIWLFIGEKSGTHWDKSIPVNSVDIITHLLLIHDFTNSTLFQINHVLWSIAVEFRIYLFFPLLVVVWRNRGMFATLICAVVIAVTGLICLLFARKYLNPDIPVLWSGVYPYLILFTLGMVAADLSFSKQKLQTRARAVYFSLTQRKLVFWAAVIFLFLSGISLVILSGYIHLYVHHFSIEVFSGVVFSWLLFELATSNADTNWLKKALQYQPFVFIGSFSYSLYLIHAPIIQVLSQYVFEPMHLPEFTITLLLLIIGTPLMVGIAYVFFLLFERPFLTMGKSKKMLVKETAFIV